MLWMNRAARSLPALHRATAKLPSTSFSTAAMALRRWKPTALPTATALTVNQSRSVWSAGETPFLIPHPSACMTPEELKGTSKAVKAELGEDIRFVAMTVLEGPKSVVDPPRQAEVIVLKDGIGIEMVVDLPSYKIVSSESLPPGVQPVSRPPQARTTPYRSCSNSSPIHYIVPHTTIAPLPFLRSCNTDVYAGRLRTGGINFPQLSRVGQDLARSLRHYRSQNASRL